MRGVDQLEARRAQGVQGRPAELALGIQRLRVRGRVAHLAPLDRGTQRAAFDRRRHGQPRVVEQRRQHVDAAGDGGGHAAGGHSRSGHDPRHPQRGVVDEEAVRSLAVLAQALAVIGGGQDDRPL